MTPRIFFISLAAVLVWILPACTPHQTDTVPELRLSAAQDSFVNKTAYVSFTLSEVSRQDVIISITVKGDIESKYLTFQNPVTIRAGEVTTSMIVTVDDSSLPDGNYSVLISVEGVFGAKLTGDSYVLLKMSPSDGSSEGGGEDYHGVKLREDWHLTYVGDTDEGNSFGLMESVMNVSGFENSGAIGFYIRGIDSKLFQSLYKSDVSKFIAAIQEDIKNSREHGNAYPIRSQDNNYYYDRLSPGSYEFFMLGCDLAGDLTGEYSKVSFNRAPTSTVTYYYSKWLGKWEVNGDVWNIEAGEYNSSFEITGIAGINAKFKAVIGWDGELLFRGGYYADVSETDRYFVYSYTGSYLYSYSCPALKAVMDDYLKCAQMSGCINPYTGELFEGFAIYSYREADYIPFDVPERMNREHEGVFPSEENYFGRWAPYESFLGDWDDGTRSFTLQAEEWGKSFRMTDNTEYQTFTDIILDYSPEYGHLTISEQIIYQSGSYAFILTGADRDIDARYRPYYPEYSTELGTKFCNVYMYRDGGLYFDGEYLDDHLLWNFGIVGVRYNADNSIYAWEWYVYDEEVFHTNGKTFYHPSI